MKLSEAMRKGAELTIQARGSLLELSGTEAPAATCAIGAAYVGLKGKEVIAEDWSYRQVEEEFPELMERHVNLPVAGPNELETMQMEYAIWKLNDRLHWTREAIADWLEGQGF